MAILLQEIDGEKRQIWMTSGTLVTAASSSLLMKLSRH
jgi:hypothetical protein